MDLIEALAAEVASRVLPLLAAAMPAPREELPLMLDVDRIGIELGGLSETSVRALWRSKELPSVKVGGLRRTRRADFLAYVEGLPLVGTSDFAPVSEAA